MAESVSTMGAEHLLINFNFIMSSLYYIKTTEIDAKFFFQKLATYKQSLEPSSN